MRKANEIRKWAAFLLVAVDEGALPSEYEVLLEKLAAGKVEVSKVSRRDMPWFWLRWNGATTVSGTLIACHLAGIRVFVTGGMGEFTGEQREF